MNLHQALQNYTPFDAPEAEMWARFQAFLAQNEGANLFANDLVGSAPDWGHITASAWIVNSERTRFVLVHGAKSGRWQLPGAHCEGEGDLLHVAQRAAASQAHLEVVPLIHALFDLRVELVPEYWNTPPHRHYDLRFCFVADESQTPSPGANIIAARWCAFDEIATFNDAELTRLVEKTRQLKIE